MLLKSVMLFDLLQEFGGGFFFWKSANRRQFGAKMLFLKKGLGNLLIFSLTIEQQLLSTISSGHQTVWRAKIRVTHT